MVCQWIKDITYTNWQLSRFTKHMYILDTLWRWQNTTNQDWQNRDQNYNFALSLYKTLYLLLKIIFIFTSTKKKSWLIPFQNGLNTMIKCPWSQVKVTHWITSYTVRTALDGYCIWSVAGVYSTCYSANYKQKFQLITNI